MPRPTRAAGPRPPLPVLGLTLAALAALGAGCGESSPSGSPAPPASPPVSASSPDPSAPRYGATPTAPPTQAPTACPASGVRVQPGLTDAALGLRAMTITLVNCGKQPYTVNGYPEVRVLNGNRDAIQVEVDRGAKAITSGAGDPGPAPVTLRPGEQATAGVLWRNTVTSGTTPAANGVYLEVTPGGPAAAQTVRPDGPIDLGNTWKLGVTAWEKADSPAAAAPRP
ncbi:hypothetical protein GCM10027168_51220 [Streptomyces capparidis]